MTSPSSGEGRQSGSELSWATLYRIGAIAAGVAVLLYVAALTMVTATTAPPTTGGAQVLAYVDAHRTTYIVRQLLWSVPSLLLMVTFLALTVALRQVNRGLASVAGMIAIASWVVSFAWPTTGDGSLTMVLLSDSYAAVTSEAGRAPFVAGAELLIALNDTPSMIGVLQTIGILSVALLMLMGTFSKGLAWLGVATGAIGVVSEVLRPVLGWAYALYGILLFAWLVWIAIALWRLATEAHQRTAHGAAT